MDMCDIGNMMYWNRLESMETKRKKMSFTKPKKTFYSIVVMHFLFDFSITRFGQPYIVSIIAA